MDIFLSKLEELLKINNLSRTKFANEIGITEASIRSWYKGTIPKMDVIIKISKYFSISVDNLIGTEQKYTEEEQQIIDRYRQLDKESKQAFRTLLHVRLTNQENTGKSSEYKIG